LIRAFEEKLLPFFPKPNGYSFFENAPAAIPAERLMPG